MQNKKICKQIFATNFLKANQLKLIIALVLLLNSSVLFAQWKRVEQLPASDIHSLNREGNTLYAGGKDIIYISVDTGQTWDSTSRIPQFISVDNVIIFKNELFVSSYSIGVAKSVDGGRTWQNITSGIIPFVSDFCIWNGDLYAATLGNSVYKLDPVLRNRWLTFSEGLSSLSANINSIAATNHAMVAGTLANGIYDHRPVNSTVWEERLLSGQVRPTEGVYDIITANDSLLLAGKSGTFYISTDYGLSWSRFGGLLPSTFTSLANAREALLLASNTFNGVNNTSFLYLKKDSFTESFVPFSFVPDHFTYKLDIYAGWIWDASTKGLFYMSLSALPGITDAEDPTGPLAFLFTSFNVQCDRAAVQLNWTAVHEQNSSRFKIERSANGIHWKVIGEIPSVSNSTTENHYSFTDEKPLENNFYRIAMYELEGKQQYSSIRQSSCTGIDVFRLWPNPVNDLVFVNIVTANASKATIKLFDSKGALVRIQNVTVSHGSNLFTVDLQLLAGGVYLLSADWNNGQKHKTIRLVKQ